MMDLDVTPLRDWGLPIERMCLAAGPCSAESEAQILATAEALRDAGLTFFRAGVWKPRTRPGCFEGVGEAGLDWLVRAREATGLAVGVEVATVEHVQACAERGIDVVWIGARTTPNPFAIHELATALVDTGMAVFLKNPISPDLELWMGALERLCQAGLKKVGVIHRGFSTSAPGLYRYAPTWRIPIELKRRLPGLPVLCDPSHIGGDASLIEHLAQEALDLLYDGLMIEVHPNPATAMSDAKQQLTPSQFLDLLGRLTIKTEEADSEDFQRQLDQLRAEVDGLDRSLLELLGERMAIVRAMGDLKSRNQVSTLQPHRWDEIVADRLAAGDEKGLAKEFVFQIFEAIHEEAIRQQEEGG